MSTARKVDRRGLLNAIVTLKRTTKVNYRDHIVALEKDNTHPIWRQAEVSGFDGSFSFRGGLEGHLDLVRNIDLLIDILEDNDQWGVGFSIGWKAACEEYKVGDFAPKEAS